MGPVGALVGHLCCNFINNTLNIPPQPFKPGENVTDVFTSVVICMSQKPLPHNFTVKVLVYMASVTSADSFVRGASQFTPAGDAGGGGGVHLPSLHGGRRAGAFPLHPLLPAGHAQVRRRHLSPPPRAPRHPCCKD